MEPGSRQAGVCRGSGWQVAWAQGPFRPAPPTHWPPVYLPKGPNSCLQAPGLAVTQSCLLIRITPGSLRRGQRRPSVILVPSQREKHVPQLLAASVESDPLPGLPAPSVSP